MNSRVTVDGGGRILIPKKFRHRLALEPGDVLEISEFQEQINLRPVRQTLPLEKRHGFWVYTGEADAAVGPGETLLANDRDARAAALVPGAPGENRSNR